MVTAAGAQGVVADLVAPLAHLVGRPGARRAAHGVHRTHLEVRGVQRPERSEARQLVVEELHAVPGVRAAVVNAVLGRVVVDHDPDVPLAALVRVVAEIERVHGLDLDVPASAGAHHPADPTALTRQMIALTLDLVGLGVVGLERTLGPAPLTTAVPPLASGLLSLADAVPAVRGAIERTVGGPSTESWFSLGSAAVQAVGRGPLGLAADACFRVIKAGEATSRAAVWAAFDEAAELDEHHADPQEASGERPVPAPPGVVDQVGDAAGVVAVGALGVAAVLVPERAAAVLFAGIPKAGRWGREAFACAAHRALCGLGVVVMDPTALRRADRVDVVLLPSALAADADVQGAASTVGRVVVTTGPARPAVLDLQRDGHAVAVVSADDADALAAADVAIGVTGPGGAPPWTAAMRCATHEQVVAVLCAVAAAPAASRRAATLAVLASLAGAPIALTGELTGVAGRTNLPVTLGALTALGVGTWTGRGAPTAHGGR